MKFLKFVLALVVVLVAVFVGGGLMMGDKVHVERSIVIDRSPAQVYTFLSDFRRFQEWSPWGKEEDPGMVTTLSGPPTGVGAKMTWQGEKVGAGSSTISSVVENERVTVDLDFGSQGKAIGYYALAPQGAGTQVTWAFDVDAEGNLIGRWFNLLMDSMVGPDYERGLAKMKQVIEADPLPAPPAPAVDESLPADDAAEGEGEEGDTAPAAAEEESDAESATG